MAVDQQLEAEGLERGDKLIGKLEVVAGIGHEDLELLAPGAQLDAAIGIPKITAVSSRPAGPSLHAVVKYSPKNSVRAGWRKASRAGELIGALGSSDLRGAAQFSASRQRWGRSV